MVDELWTGALWALTPTIVVLGLFFFVLRGILRMDRTERRSYARIEAEERAKRGMTPPEAESTPPAAARR